MKSKPAIEAVSKMPAFSHWPDKSKPFDIDSSEVARWIVSQPAVKRWVFETMKDSGVIQFDGVNWHGKSV